jgi:hypothetical protein
MRKVIGYVFAVLAVAFYILGLMAWLKNVESARWLWLTVTSIRLMTNFVAQGLGSLGPALLFHYLAARLLRRAQVPIPNTE